MPVKISVIVPVYNTGNYLDKCLNSLVSQTLPEIEIIAVNDGSPDNSQVIIDSFVNKFPGKITALRQDNLGPGPARNNGISVAKGEYVGFVDSDDYVEKNMYELMYTGAIANNSDIVVCDFYMENDSGSIRQPADIWGKGENIPGSISEYIKTSTNPAMLCNKIFKKELFSQIKIPSGWYEDLSTTPVVMSNCKTITAVNKPLYHYVKRSGTITAQDNNLKNLDVLKAWKRCLDECNRAYTDEMAYAIYISICFFLDFRREHIKEIFEFFRRNEDKFTDNKYIQEKIECKKLADLFEYAKMNM